MILAMALTTFLVAGIRTALEFVSPTYSGFGPWRPMIEMQVISLALSCLLLIVEAVGTLLSARGTHARRGYLLTAGCISALGASGPLIGRISYPLFGLRAPDWPILLLAVIFAMAMRLRANQSKP